MGCGGKRAQPGPRRRGQPQGTAPGVPTSPPSVPPRGEAPQGKEPTSPAGAGLCSRVRRAQPGTWLCRDSDGDRPVLTPTAAFPSIPLTPGYRFGKLGVPRSPQTRRVGRGQGWTRSGAEPDRTESGAGVWHVPGRGFRALLGGGRSRAPEQPHRVRFVWGSPPPLCPWPPRAAAGALCCSGLAGQLADPLAEVEGELEHGGRQALVDEVPGQATLQVRV